MTLVVLAAGMGSRYGGLKQMDPMNADGDFIIDYSVYDAIQAGFDEVIFIIKRAMEQDFRETIGARISGKIKMTLVFQDMDDLPEGYILPEGRVKPWGTTHALRAARDAIKGPYGVINADDFYGRDTFMKLAAHLRKMESGELGSDKEHACAIGFKVKNTLTDKGTASRGVCEVNEEGMLTSIVERLKIRKCGGDAEYEDEAGNWVFLPGETVVSMNCWGLPASSISCFKDEFVEFMQKLPEAPNPLKAEILLPNSVEKMMEAGLLDVRVYPTESEWFGVTYTEDKPWVQGSIRALTEAGVYPEHLWAN